MDKIRQLMEKWSGIQYRINNNDKSPRNFGTDFPLYQSEIHMIDAIGPGEGIGASALAKKLCITNGAVVQTAGKLLDKKLIEKFRKEGNKKEVYYRLTEMGMVGYENHKKFHEQFNIMITTYLAQLNEREFKAIGDLVDLLDLYIPDLNREE